MINCGEINSGSTIGLPFKILGQTVSSVELTLGHYDENQDFHVELGPNLPWEIGVSGDYSIVYIGNEYNQATTEMDKFAFVKVTTSDDLVFVVEFKYHIKLLPYSEEFGNEGDPDENA